MRAAIRNVLLAAMIVGGTGIRSAHATESHTTVCVVSATATAGTPVNYFALGLPPVTWTVMFSAPAGCISSSGLLVPLAASFTLAGWCELATTVQPSNSDIRAVNGLLVISGAVNGTLKMTGTDPCVYRSPTVFITGTLVFN